VVPLEPRGYLRTWLGALIGALPGGLILGFLAFAIAVGTRPETGDLADVFYFVVVIVIGLIGMALGIWIGAVVGSWLALRIGKYVTPWRTAVPLAIIFPVSAIPILIVLFNILDAELPGFVYGIALLLAVLGLVSVPALGGRAWYRWRTTGGL
jgi:hypothetical protein